MAPAAKAFVSYAISKKVPLVVRADVRQILGGADGMVADLDAYLPPPGGSRRLIMLAGPSYTYADHRYMQKEFPARGRVSCDLQRVHAGHVETGRRELQHGRTPFGGVFLALRPAAHPKP